MRRSGSILVVDDEEIMREILEALLTREGYHVRLASSGEEGLELARSFPFDAVVVDVMMPGMDGLMLLDELKKHDDDLPVLMVTAFASVETFATFFHNLPEPVLGAIVLMAASRLVRFEELRRLRIESGPEFWTSVVACIGVLCFGLLNGLLLAAVGSLVTLIAQNQSNLLMRCGQRSRHGRMSALLEQELNPCVNPMTIDRDTHLNWSGAAE